MTDISLENKTAIVTGASSGIGAATARALASAGARVALVARRADRLASLAEDLNQETKRSDAAVALSADVATNAGVERAFADAKTALGSVDILANIAGVMLVAPVLGTNTDQWRRMVEINLMGLMQLTQKAAEHMVDRKTGHVVNVSSLAARHTSSNFAVYSATKFAVAAFTETLRKELIGTGVRTTEIMPGIVKSELAQQIEDDVIREDIGRWMESVTPLEPEDIAEAVLFAVTRPPNVAVSEMIVRPTNEEL
ncbi:SDR family oxidoreductase [Eilatimonas milleporae]|uniref:NADP-dependent 3-hydroxy acid dehydrogenase YdfG n=1 Tax=Eilatimonas milleporae TaxID=911205 RepID=A0A3M0BWN0_9PROT|nr:SDR family oxidoreductase [Eilatimonas milleporae]RMB02001.1 NADP-dependent 3-hydroxy acid dehydrogenase YdfG [Eilatimonas milleporae]